jgi:23S rRNA pseudouridine2605 synthase
MFPVGRLDRDTTGLLLFTTDSDLQNAVLRPDQRTPKTYRLWLAGDREIDPRIARLTEGTLSAGRALRAQSARVVARSNGSTQVEVILTQGKNRQLRRMCHALKLRLHRLQRTAIGPLTLGTLKPGCWRPLAEAEVDILWQALGGREKQHHEKVAALVAQAMRAREAGTPLERLEAWLSRWG